MMSDDAIQEALGATLPVGNVEVTLFIPSKDQTGAAIDQAIWRDRALEILGRLFRGATAFPPGKGVWRNDAKNGELLFEDTVLVLSYVTVSDLEKNLAELRKFLHQFGREANQGEVGLIIDSQYYGVSTFDNE